MRVQRNVEGLQKAAKKKRQQSFEKAEEGIRKLIKEKRPINFNTVAEISGVSKAWLYKQPGIRSRIEHLRQKSGSRKKTPVQHRASDASKNTLIKNLKERIKRLEADNKDLRRQNEVAYGHILKVRDLEKENQRLRAENERLRQPQQAESDSVSNFDGGFGDALSELGVKLNSTLERLISETPRGIVETAIESLKEASGDGQVRNPGGFLNKAITDAWKPNEAYQEKSDLEEFNQWWKWAYGKGLVKAATQIDGVQYVLMLDEEWMSFSNAVGDHPMHV